MSRAAVLDALRADTELMSLVPTGNIIADPQGEGRPNDVSPNNFIVLRWEESVDWNAAVQRGPRLLTVWSHHPREISTDYNDVDKILLRVGIIITSLEDVVGADDWRVTMIYPAGGWSGDLVDTGYNTVARNAGFKVLTSPD